MLTIDTDILTNFGWKSIKNLKITDKVISLNKHSKVLEYNDIINIDYKTYTGEMCCLLSKGIDLEVTKNHPLVYYTSYKPNSNIHYFYAKDISTLNTRIFIKSGILKQKGIDISNDYIKLLVWIAADGSLVNSNLCRIRVLKHRKIQQIENLLDKLKIRYSNNLQKDNSICFNFHIPDLLKKYRLKPISNVILKFNRNQLSILLEEYSKTDGCKNRGNIVIYTSKKEEADLIQASCVFNGFSCNIAKRENHGFSKKPNYELYTTDSMIRSHRYLKQRVFFKKVKNKLSWNVQCKNKTIFIRRSGKPLLVGDSYI